MDKKVWKQFDSAKYFAKINIPEDWDTLENFVEWYLEARMPMMIPFNAKVIRSDDACAVCVFRKGSYQVEFYLEYPEMYIRKHSHPRMEVITIQLGGGSMAPAQSNGTSVTWGTAAPNLLPGQYHGGDSGTMIGDGFITLAFQKWYNPAEMSSAAIQWKGELQGEYQANLIKSYYPEAFIKEGNVDITKDVTGNPV